MFLKRSLERSTFLFPSFLSKQPSFRTQTTVIVYFFPFQLSLDSYARIGNKKQVSRKRHTNSLNALNNHRSETTTVRFIGWPGFPRSPRSIRSIFMLISTSPRSRRQASRNVHVTSPQCCSESGDTVNQKTIERKIRSDFSFANKRLGRGEKVDRNEVSTTASKTTPLSVFASSIQAAPLPPAPVRQHPTSPENSVYWVTEKSSIGLSRVELR